MTNYAFVLSFLMFYFLILLSPQWNSMHWLGDPKRTSSGKWWSRMCKLKNCMPPHLYIYPCTSLQVHLIHLTWSSVLLGVQTKTTATCLSVATLTLYSLSPEPLSFLIGQSWWHHPMVWPICTKWLVFVYLSKYQDVLLWKKWKPWGKCKRVNIRQTVITLTLHVLFRPLTYALLIFNKGWTVLHIDGQMSD